MNSTSQEYFLSSDEDEDENSLEEMVVSDEENCLLEESGSMSEGENLSENTLLSEGNSKGRLPFPNVARLLTFAVRGLPPHPPPYFRELRTS